MRPGRPKALFFADGGPGMGLGHLRRCAALADAMARRGWACSFLAAGAAAREWLSVQGRRLAAARPAPKGLLPEADYGVDAFILDSYRVKNEEVASKARPRCRLIVAFDDRFDRHPVADAIVSSGVLAPDAVWPARGRLTHLLGPAFHPLPSEYASVPARRLRKEVARVLVTLGGAASLDAIEGVARLAQKRLPGAELHCLAGPFAEGAPARADTGAIRWHRDVPSIKPLLLEADLAIIGSGQTLFELAATGTPGIGVSLAENQTANLEGMAKAGVVLSAGCARDGAFEETLGRRIEEARSLAARRGLSERGMRLLDGRGAFRIEEAVSSLLAAGKTAS